MLNEWTNEPRKALPFPPSPGRFYSGGTHCWCLCTEVEQGACKGRTLHPTRCVLTHCRAFIGLTDAYPLYPSFLLMSWHFAWGNFHVASRKPWVWGESPSPTYGLRRWGPVWKFLVFLGMGQKLCLYLARDWRGIRLWCPTFQLWRKVVISGSSWKCKVPSDTFSWKAANSAGLPLLRSAICRGRRCALWPPLIFNPSPKALAVEANWVQEAWVEAVWRLAKGESQLLF